MDLVDNKMYWTGSKIRRANLDGSSIEIIASIGASGIAIARVPVEPALALPSDEAVEQDTTLTLDWNEVNNTTFYEFQVSTSSNFSNIVIDQSGIVNTSYTINGLTKCTTYYWRVRGVNVVGGGNWSEVWSFTTFIVQPIATSLVSPSDGETKVSIDPTLTWNSSFCGDSYRLQVATDSEFSTILVDQSNIANTTFSVSGLSNGTTYYWRVNATNNLGSSDWSDTWTFTTILAPPVAPTLFSPADSNTDVPIDPTFIWNASTQTTSYRLQVSTTFTFSTTVVDKSDIADTTLSVIGLSNNTNYFWHVKATNEGGTSDWSSIWQFTTIVAPPSTPTLVSPDSNETGVSTNPILTWNASSGASSYQLQVATSPSFLNPVLNQLDISDTLFTVKELSKNISYFWRVRAINIGGTSEWSEIRSFKTLILYPPTLISPSDGTTEIKTDTILVWHLSDGATSYKVQFSNASDFSITLVDTSGIKNTSYSINKKILSNNTTYFWRVKAVNQIGASDWSEVWIFNTGIITSVKQLSSNVPNDFRLEQNYPNPFNPSTNIEFDLPKAGFVTLAVYNALGEEVVTLVSKNLQAGKYGAHFDASKVASGVYLYRLQSGSFVKIKKMLLLR